MGKVILLAQQKGGAGKTTVLTQLAAHWAAEGERIAVIDLDPQRSSSRWHKARVAARGDGAGVALAEGAEWRASSDIRKAARSVDRVLVDMPGSADVLGRAAMREADLALIPCQPSMADLWATEATLRLAQKAGTSFALVLNRVPARSRAAEAVLARIAETGLPVMAERLGGRSLFAEAFMQGAGVTELSPRSRAAEEVAALAAAVDRVLAGGAVRVPEPA